MARKKQETLVLFRECFDLTRELTDEQFGFLMRAVFALRFEGVQTEAADPAVRMALRFIGDQVERYEEFCQQKREAAKKKGNSREEAPESTCH